MDRHGTLFIAAFDPSHIEGNESPYEQSFYRYHEGEWHFIDFYEYSTIDLIVQDGLTETMIAVG